MTDSFANSLVWLRSLPMNKFPAAQPSSKRPVRNLDALLRKKGTDLYVGCICSPTSCNCLNKRVEVEPRVTAGIRHLRLWLEGGKKGVNPGRNLGWHVFMNPLPRLLQPLINWPKTGDSKLRRGIPTNCWCDMIGAVRFYRGVPIAQRNTNHGDVNAGYFIHI